MIQQTEEQTTTGLNGHKVLLKDFLGIPLSSCTKTEFVDWVIARAKGDSLSTAYAINAWSVNLAFKYPEYWQALQRSDMVYCDGISVYWGCKVLGTPIPEKLTTTDCLEPIAARSADEGLSMYILGNEPGIAEQAAERLTARHSGLVIKGVHSGYFGADEERQMIAEIKRLRPEILWVGMGNPIQELWVEKHRDELRVPVVLTCGAMMEIVAGKLNRPPRWITDNGFEWAYRLIKQPRHTWRRYLIGNTVFLGRLAVHAVTKRKSA